MYNKSYLGGIWLRGERDRYAPPADAVGEDWGWVGERAELFLRESPRTSRLFAWDGLAILLRGYARPRGTSTPLDLERLAEEWRCHYLETGELDVDHLEGNFTVALCDGQAERVLLYRNLIGSGFTYYHVSAEGMLFAGNLVELTELTGRARQVNEEALPSFFLFRCVPGRETLLKDYHRLLPGEQVVWDRSGFRRRQRHTFASFRTAPIDESEALERLEATLTEVLIDGHALRSRAANLLSGGVDSSYLQALWNVAVCSDQDLPPSFSISVDHPHTWPDTDYAITASQMLGTRHLLVPADDAYETYLTDTLAATGEPLNHVQSAYFGLLGRVMEGEGFSAGICGEGADSLFGVGLANQVHNARMVRRLLPAKPLRGLAAKVAAVLGQGGEGRNVPTSIWDRLAHTCRFADRLTDWAWLDHPVNRVATFTDWQAVEACFGQAAVLRAAERRRDLLDLFDVPNDPLQRMHAIGFLGEAMDSAGLWATLFQRAGIDLLCPFLDSRVIRFALNLPDQVRFRFRRPKDLLKRALAQHVPTELATRVKLGFGQPIFEWLSPGGQLRARVEQLRDYSFVDRKTLERIQRTPTWFLSSLVTYDAWHRTILERGASATIERPSEEPASMLQA